MLQALLMIDLSSIIVFLCASLGPGAFCCVLQHHASCVHSESSIHHPRVSHSCRRASCSFQINTHVLPPRKRLLCDSCPSSGLAQHRVPPPRHVLVSHGIIPECLLQFTIVLTAERCQSTRRLNIGSVFLSEYSATA